MRFEPLPIAVQEGDQHNFRAEYPFGEPRDPIVGFLIAIVIHEPELPHERGPACLVGLRRQLLRHLYSNQGFLNAGRNFCITTLLIR